MKTAEIISATHSERSAIQSDRYLQLFEKLSPLISARATGDIAGAACDLIAELLDVEACSILLSDPARNGFALRGATHIPLTEWDSVVVPYDKGICGRVHTTGKPLLLRKASDFAAFGIVPKTRYGRPSCVVAPLKFRGGVVVGVINVASPRKSRPFNNRDVELLMAAAHLIAGGLENSHLFQETLQMFQRLEDILDSINVAIVALDNDFKVVQHNHRFGELTGKTPVELQSGDLRTILGTPLFSVCSRLIRDVTQSEGLRQERFQGELAGKPMTLEITISKVQSSGTPPGAFLLMLEDIIEEEEVRRLREADSLKRSFLRIVSHELRTPLTVIQGALPLLQTCCESPNGSLAERLVQIERLLRPNVQRLTGVVNSVLDVVDIENGKLELTIRPLDLNKLLHERITGAQESAQTKRLIWKIELDPTLPLIAGDMQRLRQVFYELIDNAIKFSDRDGAIHVRSNAEGGMAVIRISNFGDPIVPQMREQVFEKFYQLDRNLNRRCGGCGLGLFLTRNIVRLHGGGVQIEDGGEGETVFVVKLPLKQPAGAES